MELTEKNQIFLDDYLRLEGSKAKNIFLQLLENGMDKELTINVLSNLLDREKKAKVYYICILNSRWKGQHQ